MKGRRQGGGSIRLSPKHGVNPSLALCYLCQEETGDIILPGKLPDDAEAPRRAVWTREPCDKCKGWMDQGCIFISVRDGEPDHVNPYRTGGWVVLKTEAVERMREVVKPESLIDHILQARVAFLEDATWNALGLPRGDVKPDR
jgi:hypothetical protein